MWGEGVPQSADSYD